MEPKDMDVLIRLLDQIAGSMTDHSNLLDFIGHQIERVADALESTGDPSEVVLVKGGFEDNGD